MPSGFIIKPDIWNPVHPERVKNIRCWLNTSPSFNGGHLTAGSGAWRILILMSTLLLFLASSAMAQEADIKGQLSTWLTGKPGDNPEVSLGLRYIPEVSLAASLAQNLEISGEAALAVHGLATLRPGGKRTTRAMLIPIVYGSALLLLNSKCGAACRKSISAQLHCCAP